jgi:microcystin-dependent protein
VTEEYDGFANIFSGGADPFSGQDAYSTIWEHPIPWDQMQKYFLPIFRESTRVVLSLLSENSKSLEDYLRTALIKINGGSIYGDLSISGTLLVGGNPVMAMPSGMVAQFAGSTAPGGWLFCDGTAYSQSLYSDLYTAIGSTYNTHCGQSAPSAGTFRVPNYKGRVLVGFDSSDGDFNQLTDYGGAKTHTLTTSEIPAHSHGVTHNLGGIYGYIGLHDHDLTGGGELASEPVGGTLVTNPSISTDNTGGGGAHNNMQPYAVVNYIIKY